MTPKIVNWVGGVIILGILVLIVVAALYEMIGGGSNVRNEIIALGGVALVVVGAVALRFLQRRRR